MNILIASASAEDARYFPEALPGHVVTVAEGIPTGNESNIEALAIVHGSEIASEILDGMPKLRLIVTRSTGYDHIDLADAARRGISVCNVPEYGSVTVAEFTFALILSLTRKIPWAVAETRNGTFCADGLIGMDLAGKTLGIIGLGKIGRNLARMAEAFSMAVVTHDKYKPDSNSLDELLVKADVVALCCPLTPETHHLIDGATLAQMKPTAHLVNAARGPVVDSVALLEALNSGKLAGAALDVLEGEEAIRDGKTDSLLEVNRALMQHERVIVTPHLAFDSAEALGQIRETTAEILRAFALGRLLNAVQTTETS